MRERALTVKQPWADLIMAGVKDVENRTWPVPSTLPQWWRCPECGWGFTNTALLGEQPICGQCAAPWNSKRPRMALDGPFPFRLWLHAGKGHDHMACLRYPHEVWTEPTNFGALLGSVEVTGCHHADDCRWTRGAYWPGRGEQWENFCSRWAEPDTWHWTLEKPRPLDVPVPMRGRQGLWTLEEVPANA